MYSFCILCISEKDSCYSSCSYPVPFVHQPINETDVAVCVQQYFCCTSKISLIKMSHRRPKCAPLSVSFSSSIPTAFLFYNAFTWMSCVLAKLERLASCLLFPLSLHYVVLIHRLLNVHLTMIFIASYVIFEYTINTPVLFSSTSYFVYQILHLVIQRNWYRDKES